MAKKRSIIPNFFTLSNMIMGFLAIIFASRGDAQSLAISGIFIFAGSIFDLTDGAVARALNVASPIGVQLDSFADAVTYGIAPGIIAYNAYLNNLSYGFCGVDLGMLVAVFFPVCTIYRLARFNITESCDGFSGLPSPAAGIVVSVIPSLAVSRYSLVNIPDFYMPIEYFILIYIVIALLMVSKVDYRKVFTDIAHKGKSLFIGILICLGILLVCFGMWSVFICFSLYIAFGLIHYIVTFNK